MKKFIIRSKFKEGQRLFTLHEGKIVSGIVSGYDHKIISERNFISNYTRYEIDTGEWKDNYDRYVMANEDDCYTSQKALITAIKK